MMDNFFHVVHLDTQKLINRYKAGGFVYLSTQMGALVWLTYAEQGLSWDVVEPLTSLIGTAGSILYIAFYKWSYMDFSFSGLFAKAGMRAEEKVYKTWHIQREFSKLVVLLDMPLNEIGDLYKKRDQLRMEREALVTDLRPWTNPQILKAWHK